MASKFKYQVATVNTEQETQLIIPPGATISPVFDGGGCAPASLYIPSAFTAASITFLVSKYNRNGAFLPLVNFDGTAFAISITAPCNLPLLPAMFNNVIYFQIVFSAAQVTGYNIDVGLSPYFQGIHG